MNPAASKLVVVGQGYVGLPLAMRAVDVGYDVVGFEHNPERLKRLSAAATYVQDVSSDALQRALDSGRYLPTDERQRLAKFDAALITVPTPLREGRPDLRYIEEAGNLLSRYLTSGAVVVLESTTYPGTTEELLADILEKGSGLRAGTDFHLGYSPERIDPANKDHTAVTTPKLVSGVSAESLSAIRRLYESLVETVVPVSRPREAELAKLLENTFRHVNIALVNELAMFAAELDVDIWESIDAAATKPFGFMRFQPGPGVGGHCLPVDPSYLSWHVRTTLGRSFRFVELANDINEHMPDYVMRRLMVGLSRQGKAVTGSNILLLGISYKRNTSDVRESPALPLAEQLLRLGASVSYVDGHAAELDNVEARLGEPFPKVMLTKDVLSHADAVVLLTDHDDFDYGLIERSSRYVLDTRHRCVGLNIEYL